MTELVRGLITNKIIIKVYSDGKDEALKELREQIKKHPNDSTLMIKKTKFLEKM